MELKMQKQISNAYNNWIRSMDEDTNKIMGEFLAKLSDYNIHMLPTKKSVDGIMEYIYTGEQDTIIESLYEFKYYLHVNEINDAELKSMGGINKSLSESKLFTTDLRDMIKVSDEYKEDILFLLLYVVRINITYILNALKDK